MVCLFMGLPPGEKIQWWFHAPLLRWIGEQPWASLLAGLILTTWFCQGVLLAFWLVWGTGHLAHRFYKVMGLATTVALLPAIWFVRHSGLYRSAPIPWSEVLNLSYLSDYFLWALGISFLPALLVFGTLYKMRFRLQQVVVPSSSLGKWQFSLRGLLLLTLFCSLLLAFFNWGLPNMVTFLSLPNIGFYFGEMELLSGRSAIALGSALTALLSATILYQRNWRVTTAIISILLVIWFMAIIAETLFPTSVSLNPFLIPSHLAGTLTLGNLVSLAISRYWIGWNRFKLIRLSKQASR